jgi:asparagine synthase (glutamine-hydrolysing)
MCGIAAIFNYRTGQPVARAELTALRDHMAARGPDGAGEWYSADQRVGLGHRRLSIIDLSPAGAQPMTNANGTLVVIFNGEIYNYRQLRSQLEQHGCRFQSTSDTEVLLHLYEREGREMVHQLRGMYAFALWDERKQGLFLARDPFGIKPLYCSDDGKTLRIASQVKALLAGGGVDTSPEPAGHVGFFLWGHVPSPYTLYRGIRGLSAGTTLWVDSTGNHGEQTFCSVPRILAEAEQAPPTTHHAPRTTAPQRAELLRSVLADSVQHHLIADVPVGVFLSSGLDSTTITALASETCSDLRTVTLAFEEYRRTPADESSLAAEVAALCGARHQTVWVSKQDFRDNFSRVLQAMDQPSCDGINSFFVSLAAARAGLKVALSGLGGDELFGGYPSFREIPRLVRFLRPFNAPSLQPFNRAYRLLSVPVLRRLTSPKYAGLLEYGGTWGGAYLLRRGMFMPWELPEVLDPDLVRQGWDDLQPLARLEEAAGAVHSPFLKISALELSFYMRNQLLRDTDWASMDHSIEVRTPLVDVQLLRDLAPLLAGHTPPTKRDLALAPISQLPSSILNRPKTGFSIPVRQWLLDEDPGSEHERGLRGWTRLVYSAHLGNPAAPSLRPRAAAGPGFQTTTRDLRAKSRLTPAPPPPAGTNGDHPILALLTDGFGGHGGIAKFNRDLLSALCSSPGFGQVAAIARLMPDQPENLPPRLAWRTDGLGGKFSYTRAVAREALRARRARIQPRLIVCAHINLLPIAFLARRLLSFRSPPSRSPSSSGQWSRSPLSRSPWSRGLSSPPIVLFIHGIDAWQPTGSRLANALARKVQAVVAVSALTRDRFAQWSGLPISRAHVLPNSVDLSKFQPGPKPEYLLKRYGLCDRRVLLTVGRLASRERQKGFDEVLEVLPALAREFPALSYLIVGDGDDRHRLVAKARSLGLTVRDFAQATPSSYLPSPVSSPVTLHASRIMPLVVFTGYVPEAEKADHYRAADLYVMPSRGEGFGIVYLEALACGLPVIGSKADGSREALRDGLLGTLVDPADPEELKTAIRQGLGQRPRSVPEALSYFSYAEFEKRCHALLRQVVPEPEPQPDRPPSA